MTDPDGHITAFLSTTTQLCPIQATVVTDGAGNITSNVYDNDGNLCVTGAESTSLYGSGYQASCGFTSGYTYDTFDQLGNVMSTTNPSNDKTTSYGRADSAFPADVTSVTPPADVNSASAPTDYTYDADGRVHTKQVMASGGVQEVQDDHLVQSHGDACVGPCRWLRPGDSCSTNVGSVVGATIFAYNASELPYGMADVTGGTPNFTGWTYDAQGQELSTSNNDGTVNYGYDPAGDNTCVGYPTPTSAGTCGTTPSGSSVQYGYDLDGRMSSMTDWLGHTTSFGYDTNSNVNSIQYPSSAGWYDKYVYDNASNLTCSQYITLGSYTSPTQVFAPNGDNHYSTDEKVSEVVQRQGSSDPIGRADDRIQPRRRGQSKISRRASNRCHMRRTQNCPARPRVLPLRLSISTMQMAIGVPRAPPHSRIAHR